MNITGTVITEWNDGKARCEEFLKSEDSYKQFADQLVQISKYYGFDGWLINIENKIEVVVSVLLLKLKVIRMDSTLREVLMKLHFEG